MKLNLKFGKWNTTKLKTIQSIYMRVCASPEMSTFDWMLLRLEKRNCNIYVTVIIFINKILNLWKIIQTASQVRQAILIVIATIQSKGLEKHVRYIHQQIVCEFIFTDYNGHFCTHNMSSLHIIMYRHDAR